MAKKQYSKAEKMSFKKGMQAQYSKEHPLLRYVAYPRFQNYNEDGTKSHSYTGLKVGFKTLKEAKACADDGNDRARYVNAHVMDSVKKKKVNVYDSQESQTEHWVYEKVKPFRK